MEKGICPVSLLPVRAEPAHQAEMTSELLFGELFEVGESRNNWLHITSEWDGFSGWVEESGILAVTQAFYREAAYMNVIVGEPHLAYEYSRPEHPYRILPGSSLPFYRPDNQSFSLGQKTLQLDSPTPLHNTAADGEEVVSAAMKFAHTPYRWGGRSMFGIDADGLIQVALKICRIRSGRKISQQLSLGTVLHFLEEALSGDLLFFGNDGEEITHAGIYLAPGRVIHAFGKVRIDQVDHHGIFNQAALKYTHHLRTIVRIAGISHRLLKNS